MGRKKETVSISGNFLNGFNVLALVDGYYVSTNVVCEYLIEVIRHAEDNYPGRTIFLDGKKITKKVLSKIESDYYDELELESLGEEIDE